jgi:protein O-GlcNAc transferase
MLSDSQHTDSREKAFEQLMTVGTAAHAAGDPVKALTAFESALALNEQDDRAVSACAALLFELSRPRAAFSLLKSIESQLLQNADGCANLGLAALSCNHLQEASAYFEQALKLQPTHSAALTHLGVLTARERRWHDAIGHARQCVLGLPNDETSHANLIDYLLGARSVTEALAHLQACPEPLKNQPQIAIRKVVALALDAQFDAANLAMTQLSPPARHELADLMQRGGATDLPHLFHSQALDAMQDCDWRDYDRLRAVVGEKNLHRGHSTQAWSRAADKSKAPPPFARNQSAIKPSDKIRIGIASISLRDSAATEALATELSLYDSARFSFHVYAPTPQPQAVLSSPLAAHQVVEMAHLTDEEAVWRIRLDRLDIWFDLTLNTPWHRLAIAQYRVAPLQVLPLPAPQPWPDGIYDYTFTDGYLQAELSASPSSTAQARLPYACWTVGRAAAAPNPSRHIAGLADDAFVVCVFGPCAHITPQTFAGWMQLLGAVPNAVLWLSVCSPSAQANLRREALQVGIHPERIIFLVITADLQNLLPLADLFLTASGGNPAQTLIAALGSGVPAMAAALPMASSVLQAAGLGDGYFHSTEACLSRAFELAQNPNELKALRERVQLSVGKSPLVDAANRASERAVAWTVMVERSRAGLQPVSFDVPIANTSG